MKRTLIVLASILVLAFGTLAVAQQHGGMGMGQGMGQGSGHGMGPGQGMGRIVDLLQLTADQKTQWDALHSQLATTIQPLIDQRTAAQQQLQTLIGAASPDATAIGKQVLAIQAINKQIAAAHDATEQQIANILTPDQKTKFDAWKATRPAMMGGGLCSGAVPGGCANCPIH